jgi:hypothetical protein
MPRWSLHVRHPITTNYIWQAREQGARIIVQDPRITPIARTCGLYLPVKPGRDAALFAGVLQLMIEHDWLDHEFIRTLTVGFDEVAAYCREWTVSRTADVTGVPVRSIQQAAEWWGTAATLSVSCPRHRAPLQRRAERARHDQPRPRDGRHWQTEERIRNDHRTGQRPGWTRARAKVRSAAGLAGPQQP